MCIKKIKNKTHAYLMFFDIVVSFQESECSSWVVFVAEGPIRFIIGQLRMHAPRSFNKCSDRSMKVSPPALSGNNNRPTDQDRTTDTPVHWEFTLQIRIRPNAHMRKTKLKYEHIRSIHVCKK